MSQPVSEEPEGKEKLKIIKKMLMNKRNTKIIDFCYFHQLFSFIILFLSFSSPSLPFGPTKNPTIETLHFLSPIVEEVLSPWPSTHYEGYDYWLPTVLSSLSVSSSRKRTETENRGQ
jgi:hypothetical protein